MVKADQLWEYFCEERNEAFQADRAGQFRLAQKLFRSSEQLYEEFVEAEKARSE